MQSTVCEALLVADSVQRLREKKQREQAILQIACEERRTRSLNLRDGTNSTSAEIARQSRREPSR